MSTSIVETLEKKAWSWLNPLINILVQFQWRFSSTFSCSSIKNEYQKLRKLIRQASKIKRPDKRSCIQDVTWTSYSLHFHQFFGCPKANICPLTRRQSHLILSIIVPCLIWFEGQKETRNEVMSRNPAERIS